MKPILNRVRWRINDLVTHHHPSHAIHFFQNSFLKLLPSTMRRRFNTTVTKMKKIIKQKHQTPKYSNSVSHKRIFSF
jgi:hypothetical protein